MARTFRTVDPRSKRWTFWRGQREQRMYAKGAKTFRSTKAGCATVDNEGGFKLNKWDTSNDRRQANQDIRRTARVQIARQLEEID